MFIGRGVRVHHPDREPVIAVRRRLPRCLIVTLTADREGAQLVVDADTTATDGRPYRWRLVARNGRVLGRSSGRFASRAAATEHFHGLADDAERLTVSVIHAGPPGGWVWRIEDESGEAAVEAAKRFERHASCQRAGRRMAQHLREMSGT